MGRCLVVSVAPIVLLASLLTGCGPTIHTGVEDARLTMRVNVRSTSRAAQDRDEESSRPLSEASLSA